MIRIQLLYLYRWHEADLTGCTNDYGDVKSLTMKPTDADGMNVKEVREYVPSAHHLQSLTFAADRSIMLPVTLIKFLINHQTNALNQRPFLFSFLNTTFPPPLGSHGRHYFHQFSNRRADG